MLAFIRTPKALEQVLAIASAHGSRAVRIAALDAYIFNHDDSPEAIERARGAARSSEAKFVGLARRERDGNPHEFDAKVRAFYQRYPEECPPAAVTHAVQTHHNLPRERNSADYK